MTTTTPTGRGRTKDPLTETPRHRPLPGGWEQRKPIAAAVKRYEAAAEAHGAIVGEWEQLEADRDEADAADRKATAAAYIKDGTDPGAKALDAIAAKLVDGRRRLEALYEAAGEAAGEVDRAYAEDRDDWREAERKARAKDEAEEAKALEHALDLHAAAAARTLRIRQLHPQARPGATGKGLSHRPEPAIHGAPFNPALAIEIIIDNLAQPYENEGEHGMTTAGSQ